MTIEKFLSGVEAIYQEHPSYERGHDGSDGKWGYGVPRKPKET